MKTSYYKILSHFMFALAFMLPVLVNAQTVDVTSADPATGEQGSSNLDVTIGGKGFDNSAEVRFLVTTTENPGGITVNHVNYVRKNKLIANIDIADDADVAEFDIEVTLRSAPDRGGKGTTLFRVSKKVASRIATLDITYEFGSLTDGLCTESPKCVSSTIRATGLIECGEISCEFKANADDALFELPSSLRNLLFATEWRRTPLNPDMCFGSSDFAPGIAVLGTSAETGRAHNIVFLRWYSGGSSPWEASVGSFARDIDDLQDRQHIFNFEGCGAAGNCGNFDRGLMDGIYAGGELLRIDSHGNDRKFDSIPCRCTRSNTPDCPDEVPVATPQLRITVDELP
jgi:hypothetical protein